MRLADTRKAFTDRSAKLSDIVRQAGFAGIAVVWLFSERTPGAERIPRDLLLPALLMVVGLGLDLLQYAYASAAWGTFSRSTEKKLIAKHGADALRVTGVPDPLGETVENLPATNNLPSGCAVMA